jgi:parallel beta-helix repeat protein
VQVPFNAMMGYLNTVIPGNGAQTYCLAVGQYEMGTAALHYDNGDVIVGVTGTHGPNGEVAAPTLIHSTAGAGVIEAQTGDTNLTINWVDLCCSPYVDSGQTGRGVDGANSLLVNLTVTNSRIHGNGQSGIGGVGYGLVVENSEIDHNGTNHGGTDAGIKTVNYMRVNNSYIHDNSFNGLWWDCDAPGGIIENSLITANWSAGVEVEISSGDAASGKTIPPGASYGFVIRTNHIEGNNTTNTSPYGGILVSGSSNTNADGNTAINNTGHSIWFTNNARSGNGHNGCSSGFFQSNNLIQNNDYGPQNIGDCSQSGLVCLNNRQILA